MTAIQNISKVKETTISAVITRANGRVENLGVISTTKEGPLKRIAKAAGQFTRQILTVPSH
jgi:hypothetical protein